MLGDYQTAIDAIVPEIPTHIGFVATDIHGNLLITEPNGRPSDVSATFNKVKIEKNERPSEALFRCIQEQIGSEPLSIYPIPGQLDTPFSRGYYSRG